MVLVDGSGSLDGPPPSDDDRYASNVADTYTISLEGLPRPMPILGPLCGFTEERFTRILTKNMHRCATIVNRPLEKEEIESMTFWDAKKLSIMSYGRPLGIAAGCWRAWNTAGTLRFPFNIPPRKKFTPEVFVSPRMPFLKGNRAVLAWHVLRTLSYGGFGTLFGDLFFGIYAVNVGGVGEITDPRLKKFFEEYKAGLRQHRDQMPNLQGGFGAANAQVDGPTAEREQSQWDRTPPPSSAPAKKFPTEPNSQPFDVWDDTSPTGGSGVSADIQSSQPPGSAWDRIRRGERPTTQHPKGSDSGSASPSAWSRLRNNTRNGQSEEGGASDNFSYFSPNGDEQSTKEAAQRKFDAQVERERRGGDFNSGGSDQKRW